MKTNPKPTTKPTTNRYIRLYHNNDQYWISCDGHKTVYIDLDEAVLYIKHRLDRNKNLKYVGLLDLSKYDIEMMQYGDNIHE